jgi:integrase
VVKRGSFTAKIYRLSKTVKGTRYEVFRLGYYDPSGKRVLKDFGDLGGARQAAQDAAGSFGLGRPDALSFTPEERRDFEAAMSLLSPLGLTAYTGAVALTQALAALPPGTELLAAVQDFARRHPANAPKVTVSQAVDDFLEDRRRAKASEAYLSKLESHLRRFSQAFTGTLSSVTGPSVGEWMRSLATGQTKLSNRTLANHTGSVVTLFKFARSRGWIGRDLADEISEVPTPKAEALGEVGTFSAAELQRLLEAAPDDIRATLAVAALAGLRTEEVHRLDWSAVKLPQGVIIVGADRAKTGSRRVVPICPALASWLAPLVRPAGPVDPSPTSKATTHRWRRIGEKVSVPWRHNALRHSFISYRLAVVHDPAKVAFEAGNSPAMVHRHYKALTTQAAGEAWFAVTPPTRHGDNIIPLPMEATHAA